MAKDDSVDLDPYKNDHPTFAKREDKTSNADFFFLENYNNK
jgi:hypothetical protein